MVGTGLVTARFAQEAACWIEFDSAGMESAGGALDISISEGALPGEVYRIQPKRYGSLYRLETNNQLYGAWVRGCVGMYVDHVGGWLRACVRLVHH